MVDAHAGWAVSLHQREYGHRLIAHPSIECLRRHHAVLPDVGSTECGRSRAGVFDRKHATEQKYEWLLRPRFKLPIHHLWDVAGPLGFLTSDRRCPTLGREKIPSSAHSSPQKTQTEQEMSLILSLFESESSRRIHASFSMRCPCDTLHSTSCYCSHLPPTRATSKTLT